MDESKAHNWQFKLSYQSLTQETGVSKMNRKELSKFMLQCDDGPKENCKCYSCQTLHQAEDSDNDAGLNDSDFDFNKLAYHWGISSRKVFDQYDKSSFAGDVLLTKESEKELADRMMYKTFVTQFERDLAAAREINIEDIIQSMFIEFWNTIKGYFLRCGSRFSSMMAIWMHGRRIAPLNTNVSYYTYSFNIWGKKSA